MTNKHDCTILIPTCNRSAFLAAQLERVRATFAPDDVAVTVLDGSDCEGDRNREICAGYPGVDIRSYHPDIGVLDRIFLGLSKVETPFVSVLADDDVLYAPGFSSCLEFLRANPGYQGAAGHFFALIPGAEGAQPQRVRLYEGSSYEAPSALRRLREFLKLSAVALVIYGVQRTPGLKTMALATLGNADNLDHLAKELLYACVPVVLGPLKRLPVEYYARLRCRGVPRRREHKHLNQFEAAPEKTSDIKYVFHPRFSSIQNTVKSILMAHIGPEEGTPSQVSDNLDETLFLNLLLRIREDPVLVELWKKEIDANGYR